MKQGKHKFGNREADALFDLMQTLGMSNLKKPVTYLDVIKTAHKHIIELRNTIDTLTTHVKDR